MWQQIKDYFAPLWSTKPQPQKNTWSNKTEEERQKIRESWKDTLPKEFDVFSTGNFTMDISSYSEIIIPGRLYVKGNVRCKNSLIVDEDCTIDGNVNSFDLNVGGNLFIEGYAKTDDILVRGVTDIYGYISSDCIDTLEDFTAYSDVNCSMIQCKGSVTIHGDLDTSSKVKIEGDLDVNGDSTSSDTVDVSGNINVIGDVLYEDVNVNGDFTVEGNAKCCNVSVNHNFTVGGDADCYDVEVSGKFTVIGRTKCESIDVGCLDI